MGCLGSKVPERNWGHVKLNWGRGKMSFPPSPIQFDVSPILVHVQFYWAVI